MIILTNNKFNYSVEFKGSIKPIPTRLGMNKVETIYNERVTETSRFVFDLQITMDYMDNDMFDNLSIMFGKAHVITIEDSDTGDYYTGYEISGDTLDLEKKEDYKTKKFYYKGSLKLEKK